MQLSSSIVLQNVENLANQRLYVQAYQAVLDDLNSQNLRPSADDRDVLSWLAYAIQINSGATTPASLAVHINNAVADQLLNGKTIAAYGPENQASSNAVAAAFFGFLSGNGGQLQTMAQIAQNDATAGLGSLNLPLAAWTGAVPDGITFAFSFPTGGYYDMLSATQQQIADSLHVIDVVVMAEYELTANSGISSGEQNALLNNIIAYETTSGSAVNFTVDSLGYSVYQGFSTATSLFQAMYNAVSSAAISFSSAFYSLQASLNSIFGDTDTASNSLAAGPGLTVTDNSSMNATITYINNGETSNEVFFTQSNGQIAVDVSGQGALVSVSNLAVIIESNTTSTLTGSGNTVSVSSNDALTFSGSNNSISAATGADLTIDTVSLSGQSIAGSVNSGDTDAYGRQYTLSGTTLTVSAAASDSTPANTLTVNNFANGDFGVTINQGLVTTVPRATTVAQGVAAGISGVSVADNALGAGGTVTVVLSDIDGLLSANGGISGGGGTISGSGTTLLSVSGTLAQVNADLATLSYVDSSAGNDTINVATTDSSGGSDNRQIAIASLGPSGTSYVIPGAIQPENTYANVYYYVDGSNAKGPGAIISGQSTVTITNYAGKQVEVPARNEIVEYGVDDDFTQDIITNIQVLSDAGEIALTEAEFNGFDVLEGGGIVAAGGGTFDLNRYPSVSFNVTATDLIGTTLIGNNQSHETLQASQFGSDTLQAGNGSNDTLTAGKGVDTLIGGNGGDMFVADGYGALTAGSKVEGSGADNSLFTQGDISGVTISGIQTLSAQGNTTLTAAELNEFQSIDSAGVGETFYAATAGTYSLAGKTTTGAIDLAVLSGAGVTLIGNDQDGQVLTGGPLGDDTLQAGNGANDILNAGNGDDTLQAGNGANDRLKAGSGNDTLQAGNGAGDYLFAGDGVDTLIGGTGGDFFEADAGLTAGSVVEGNGSGNTLQAGLRQHADISGATVTDVQTLITNNITLSAAEFSEFNKIVDPYGDGIIRAATPGVYDLSAMGAGTSAFDMIALSDGGTTLIGNDDDETLTASATGDDVLIAAAYGDGNKLIAGAGADTLVGGAGGSVTFVATNGLAAGSTVTARGTENTLETSGDISGATISDIDTLILTGGDSITLTASELNNITALEGPSGSNLYAATGGTYDLTGSLAAMGGAFNMIALSSAGTVLEEDGAPATGLSDITLSDITLTASAAGNDTLSSSNATGVMLDAADSTGNDTLYVSGGGNNVLDATASTGNVTLNAGGDDLGGDVVYGGDGTDIIHGTFSTIYEGSGTNTIYSSGSTIYAGDGPTTIFSNGGNTIHAGDGPTTIYFGGEDTLYGGSGTEIIYNNYMYDDYNTIIAGSGDEYINIANEDTVTSNNNASLFIENGADYTTFNVSNGVVEFTSSETGTFNFTNSQGMVLLKLDHNQFNSTINGFAPGDSIDLTQVPYNDISSTSFYYNALEIFANQIYILRFDATQNFTGDHFNFAPDGNGTLITLVVEPDAWESAVSGDWSNAADWSTGETPANNSDVTIGVNGAYAVTLDTAASVASLTLADSGATFDVANQLTVSGAVNLTAGTLDLAAGGTITGATIALAGGSVSFTGGTLSGVTYQGVLDLDTTDNYAFITNGITLENADGTGPGTINVTGYDAGLYIDGSATFNDATINLMAFNADLIIEGTSTIDDATINIGGDSGYSAFVSTEIGGQAATLTLGADLTIVQAGPAVEIGDGNGANDSLVNDGAITAAISSGAFYINGNSFFNNGTIAVSNSDTMIIDAASFTNTASGSITVASEGTLYLDDNSDNGVIVVAGGMVNAASVALDGGGTISGFGTVNADITGNGIIIAGGGILDITGNVIGSGMLTFDPGALLLEGTVAPTESVVFNGADDSLILGPNADVLATISGYGAGDSIGLEDQEVLSATYDPTTHTLTISGSDGAQETLTFAGDYQQSDFAITDGVVGNNALCFTEGTRIKTPRGEVAVETLQIGDLVVTRLGDEKAIKWIGKRDYDGKFVADNHLMLPVCLKQHAIADGVPVRDLSVSPGHGIFVDGVLVPAWRLVNGVSITQAERIESVRYLHIELEAHDVIMADGCPAESFLDNGSRNQFHNDSEFQALYPDDTAGIQHPPLARVEGGFRLNNIHRRIAERAGVREQREHRGDTLRGFVDQIDANGVSGWAQAAEHPETPVRLEVWACGRLAGRVLANTYRADLRDAGLGSGCHSFEMPLPDDWSGPVEVRRSMDCAELAWTDSAMSQATAMGRIVARPSHKRSFLRQPTGPEIQSFCFRELPQMVRVGT